MPPKRKSDPKQPSLEEVTEQPVTKKRTKKGNLTSPTTSKADVSKDDLARAKLARKHGNDPAFKKKPAEPKEKSSKEKSPKEKSPETDEADDEKPNFVEINRAPVLTAWVAAVAERQGFSRTSGLTFGKSISSMLAQSKGRSIGVFEAKEKDGAAQNEKREREEELGVENVNVFGMTIKALTVDGEQLALEFGGDSAVDPKKVQQYLQRAFKDRLEDTVRVMKELAESFTEDQIGSEAYSLYEQFRPSVAQGKQGWGRKGRLEFDRMLELKA